MIEVQKLLYFLQAAGEPLRLNFVQARYGPYADNLRHVLTAVEGHLLTGFGDGSAPVLDAMPIAVLPGADDAAMDLLAQSPDTSPALIECWTSPKGWSPCTAWNC